LALGYAPGWSFADGAVNRFAKEVRVPVVPRRLFEQVVQDLAQAPVLAGGMGAGRWLIQVMSRDYAPGAVTGGQVEGS